MTSTRRASPAFTLIELLIVLGIIAILLAILFPLLSATRNAARRTACASNARQIGQLLYAYAADNRGELPATYGGDPEQAPLRPTARVSAVLRPDVGGILLLVAPPIGTARQPCTRTAKIFFCPADSIFAPHRRSEDGFSDGPEWNDIALPSPNEYMMSYAYHYVPPGGDCYQFQRYAFGTPGQGWNKGEFAGLERHKTTQRNAASLSILSELMEKDEPMNFHGIGGNVLYLDGHVAYVRSDQLPGHPDPHGKSRLIQLDRAAAAAGR